MTTGRINQIAFVEKGTETAQSHSDRSARRRCDERPGGSVCSPTKFLSFLSPVRATEKFEWWRTGSSQRPSPVLPGFRRRSERSPSCVRCLRPRCEGRRSGPSRRLTVRLDTSDKGLGTALPFPGVACMPEAQTSQPGGRSVAIGTERETLIKRVSVRVTWAVAVSL